MLRNHLNAVPTSCSVITVGDLQGTHVAVGVAISATDWLEDLGALLVTLGGGWHTWDWCKCSVWKNEKH